MTKPLRMTIKTIVGLLPKSGKVLEIGSRQEKNQKKMANLRGLFSKMEYVVFVIFQV